MEDPGSVSLVETRYHRFLLEGRLEGGEEFGDVTLAYETYGTLNEGKSNAILILHALSGDAHAAGRHHPNDPNPGWWDAMIGPGKPFDTNRYFVVCSNVLGGCRGSSGPNAIDPKTGKQYGVSFPFVTIRDMVRAQRELVRHLGIEKLFAVAGGSMGGMQALQWAVDYPEEVELAIPIATACRSSAQGIAFNEIERRAIMSDPAWNRGDYYRTGQPERGLALARMIGHITYMNEKAFEERFGRRLSNGSSFYNYAFYPEFEVENYLYHKGDSFVKRFDANSYLYITKAIDYFDISRGRGSLEEAFAGVRSKFLLISFSSDWLYPPEESERLASALRANGVDAGHKCIRTGSGHDSFLLENEEYGNLVREFLDRNYAR